MDTLYPESIQHRSRQTSRTRICPQCGSQMIEADRLVEGDFLYVWYECSEAACDEQWLTKSPVHPG